MRREPETSPTRFAWEMLGSPTWPPPGPKRGPQFGPDGPCWLCGEPTAGIGWPWRLAVPPTFTNHTLARAPDSLAVCQPCAYFGSGASWTAYVAAHPGLGLKSGQPLSWRTYSHLFSSTGHECPTLARLRSLLLDPPAPPFLLVVTTTGQKHLLFRGTVAGSREVFPVLLDEELVIVQRAALREMLVLFEALYTLGASRASISSGEYSVAELLRVGLPVFRELEARLAPYRRRQGRVLRLLEHCAQRAHEEESCTVS